MCNIRDFILALFFKAHRGRRRGFKTLISNRQIIIYTKVIKLIIIVHEKIDIEWQSLNNYTAKGMIMKNQIFHAAERNEKNISNKDINEVIARLKRSRLVHSIILFGSMAKGTEKEKSDIDICVIPKPDLEIPLKERISLNNSVPENVDISFMDELPVHIRKRIFLEGKVLYTQDMYYVLTLSKINDIEYERYKRLIMDYHKHVMERVRTRLR